MCASEEGPGKRQRTRPCAGLSLCRTFGIVYGSSSNLNLRTKPRGVILEVLVSTFYYSKPISHQGIVILYCTSGSVCVISPTLGHRFRRPPLREGRRASALQYFYHGFRPPCFLIVNLFASSCVSVGQVLSTSYFVFSRGQLIRLPSPAFFQTVLSALIHWRPLPVFFAAASLLLVPACFCLLCHLRGISYCFVFP